MILFIFEGQVEEPKIMATLEQLFLNRIEEQLICSYGADTYTLWKDIVEYQKSGYEIDVFSIIKERLHSRGDHSLDEYYSHQIESIYLFFDYDPQNRTIPADTLNLAIANMVNLFSDPMNKGQIYISYPMIEAVYCENNSCDDTYISYSVPISECKTKEWSNAYEYGRKRLKVIFKTNKSNIITEPLTEERILELKDTWTNIIKLNAIKANYITNDIIVMPEDMTDIEQNKIFDGQLQKFVNTNSSVSILSAFAIFLYEYFHGNGEF